MRTRGQKPGDSRTDYGLLRRQIERQLRGIAGCGYTPPTDNATRQGWYRRFRRLMSV